MKINKKQFRWLLVVYLIVGALKFTSKFISFPDMASQSSDVSKLLLLILVGLSVIMLVVSFIGMFRLSPRSPYIFLGALLLFISTHPLFTSWSVLLVKLGWFLGGVIVTLCIAGPVKELFIKKGSNQRVHSIAGSARSE